MGVDTGLWAALSVIPGEAKDDSGQGPTDDMSTPSRHRGRRLKSGAFLEPDAPAYRFCIAKVHFGGSDGHHSLVTRLPSSLSPVVAVTIVSPVMS